MLVVHGLDFFLAHALTFNVTAGPDALYVLTRTVRHGRGGGVTAALGLGASIALHAAVAGVGIPILAVSGTTAFKVFRLIVAAYLVYLGIELWHPSRSPRPTAISSAAAALVLGLLTNTAHPRVAIFCLAFLPNFVVRTSPYRLEASLVLALIFVAAGVLWYLALAAITDRIRRALAPSDTITKVILRLGGLIFVAFGLQLAFENW